MPESAAQDPAAVAWLLATAACRELILRSAACMDAGDAEGLAALFDIDGLLVRPDGQALQGREQIAAAYRARPPERLTVHLVAGTLFEQVDDAAASASSHVLLWSGDRNAAPGAFGRPAHARQVVGTFSDRFVQREGRWLIACRRASFVISSSD